MMTSQPESPALARLTRFSLRHRRLVVAFWMLLTIAGIVASGRAFNAFSEQYSVPGRQGYETNTAITRQFGNGGNSAPIVAVVHLPRGTTVQSPGIRAALGRVDRRIEGAVAGVRVASYASTASRAFVSADGRTTFVLAYAPPEPGSFGGSPQAARAVSGALHGLEVGGSPVHVTGLDALDASSGGSGGLGILAEALLGGVGALLVLAFVFASFLALVPLVVALCSIMTTLLLVWGLTTVASVSGIVGFLIVLVGLGVAVDYSLLIVVRWREERTHGRSPEAAIERAMTAAGRAVVFSGTTVAIGLLSLVVLPVPFLRSVGYGGLLIPLVSVAVALTLIPVILASSGPRLDWPHLRSDDRASRAWSSWATAVVRRRWLAAGVAVAVLAGLTLAATALRLGPPDGNPDVISRQGDARTGLSLLERAGLGQGILTPVEILTPRGRAAAVAARAGSVAGTNGAAAPTGPRWQRAGSAVVDAFPASESSATVDAVGDAARAADPDAQVGGIVAQNSDFSSAVYGGFPLMVGLIALLTFVLLARAFRSLLLPLKAVLLNVLSVAAAWGVVVLVWQKGFGAQFLWGIGASGSIPSWLPLMVFAFLYGLSMDYEVFILARIREEYDRTGSTEQAVIDGIGRTGRLVTSAALILFLGFVAMSSAPSTEAKMIATGLGAGVLFDATVIRALLVPAAVALLGRWNWWLPRPVARVLRVREAEAGA